MMEGWVIYDHPKDFPNQYVARRIVLHDGEVLPMSEVIASRDLEMVRLHVVEAYGKKHGRAPMCCARSDSDDPAIMETWL